MIQAICFDAFGTLVEITDKRRPFGALLRGGVNSLMAEEVLTKPLNLREVAASVSHELGETGLAELEADLQAECASSASGPESPKSGDPCGSEAWDRRLFQPGAALWGAAPHCSAGYS